MNDVYGYAQEYRARGFAIVRIEPYGKRPKDKGWTLSSHEVSDFKANNNIGIQTGRLSGDLVCVDIDNYDVLRDADAYLPPTEMIEGRPGKPRSHRWYKVINIPPELTARPEVSGGISGPQTRNFRGPDGTLIDFLGTGRHAVVPPSLWASKDGIRQEQREWFSFGEPAVVDCRELFEAVINLLTRHGYVPKQPPQQKTDRSKSQVVPELSVFVIPKGEAARQARAYLRKMDPAVDGQGGDAQTFLAACTLVKGFKLSLNEALPLLQEFNLRCRPPWFEQQLVYKLEKAMEADWPTGDKLRRSTRRIITRVLPDEPLVYVGIDCAIKPSYVDLYPSLWAGLVRVDTGCELSPELEEISWQDKRVILTPPSTIATNSRVVWAEFYLAQLLRERGAEVMSVHLPDILGRRSTLSTAEMEGKIVEPPSISHEAFVVAEQASQRGRDLDRYRKSLPRNKESKELNRAIAFLGEVGAERLTREVLRKGSRKRLSKATLRRAMKEIKIQPLLCMPDSTLLNTHQLPQSQLSIPNSTLLNTQPHSLLC